MVQWQYGPGKRNTRCHPKFGIRLTGMHSPWLIRNFPLPSDHGLPSGPWATSALERTWSDGSSGHQQHALGVARPQKTKIMCCYVVILWTQVWEASLKQLKEWLKSKTTYWPITEAILQGLAPWCNPSTAPLKSTVKGWVDQEQIGWSGMLDGWIACSWGHQQGQVWTVS